MKSLPTINVYVNYSSGNYGVNALRVEFDNLTLWYSYKTIVAFRTPGIGKVVRENDWGPTTGKHLNAIDGGRKQDRVSGEVFEKQLREVLTSMGLSE